MLFRWNYSWKEIIRLYKRKAKIYAERKKIDFDFLVKLATACLGGKSDEGTYDVDSGEGTEDMSPEKEAALRLALGDDFDKLYG